MTTAPPTPLPVPAPALVESPASLAATAAAVIALHTPTENGMCAQCLAEGRLTFHPCSNRRWAEAVAAGPGPSAARWPGEGR